MAPRVRDYEILEVFENSDYPFLGTSEIAEAIEMSSQGANNRLQKLEKEEELNSRKPGRSRIWWHTSIEKCIRNISIDIEKHEIGVDIIDSLDIPGSDKYLKARRKAVYEIFKALFSEKGQIQSSELKSKTAQLSSGTGYSMDSIWENCVRPCLHQTVLFEHQTMVGHDDKDPYSIWKPTKVAEDVFKGNRSGFWTNNAKIKEKWTSKFYEKFWDAIISDLRNLVNITRESKISDDTYIIRSEENNHKFILTYRLTNPIWFGYSGNLTIRLDIPLTHVSNLSIEDDLESKLDVDFDIDSELMEASQDENQLQISDFASINSPRTTTLRISTDLQIDPIVKPVLNNNSSINLVEKQDIEEICYRIESIQDNIRLKIN